MIDSQPEIELPPVPPPPDSVLARLFDDPYSFDFFQAVRLLELAGGKPVGRDGPPRAEAVRFGAVAGLAFPASTIAGLAQVPNRPPKLTVAFFGLTGPSGVLPEFYSQMVTAQQRAADNPERKALADWFDLFNHRMLSLFYRAWAKYRLPVAFHRTHLGSDGGSRVGPFPQTAGFDGTRGDGGSRDGPFPQAGGGHDPVTAIALSLAGLGTPAFVNRMRVESPVPAGCPDDPGFVEEGSLVRYAGLFAHPQRSAAGLEKMLADYFGVAVAVEQFCGRWMPLDAENQTRLGRRGQNDELGVSMVVGRRLWDAQGGFRVRLGPLDRDGFVSFLPDAAAGRRKLFLLAELTRFYVRAALHFEVRLVLRADDVPAAQLAKGGPGPRLGWNAWLGRRTAPGDADDATFHCRRLLRVFPE